MFEFVLVSELMIVRSSNVHCWFVSFVCLVGCLFQCCFSLLLSAKLRRMRHSQLAWASAKTLLVGWAGVLTDFCVCGLLVCK